MIVSSFEICDHVIACKVQFCSGFQVILKHESVSTESYIIKSLLRDGNAKEDSGEADGTREDCNGVKTVMSRYMLQSLRFLLFLPSSAAESRTFEPKIGFRTHIRIRTFESQRVGSSRRFEIFDFESTRQIRDSKKFKGSTALLPSSLLRFHSMGGDFNITFTNL